jgi:hypothetical protein
MKSKIKMRSNLTALMMEAVSTSETSVNICQAATFHKMAVINDDDAYKNAERLT